MLKKAIYLTLALLFSVSIFGQEKEVKNWTPELSMKYKTVNQIALSATGDMFVYVVRQAIMEGEKSEYLSHIWLASTDGTSNFQLTRGDKSVGNPKFSPCGKFIAFTSARSGSNQIWLIQVNGGEAWQFSEVKTGVNNFNWSPDGSKIAFTSADPATELEEKNRKEKNDAFIADRDFKYSHIYTIELKKNKDKKHAVKRLTKGEFDISSFDWSPDGKNVVFAHSKDPRLNTGFSNMDIAIVPSDSGEVKQLVVRKGVDSDPRFSPDGKMIAFTSNGGKEEQIGLSDVFIINADGTGLKKAGETFNRTARIICWSADNKNLFLSDAFKTTTQLYSLNVETGKVAEITSGNGVIGDIYFNQKTDLFVFSYQDAYMPEDIYVSKTAKFDKKKLTSINEDVPLPKIANVELIKWKSKDGLEIEGLLYYPKNYEKGKKYPFILNVHGGPSGVFSNNFAGEANLYLPQVFAEDGYALLYPNPRGSTGYGKDFRYANIKEWGFADFDDIMSGVDKVIAMGIAHPDSMCIMGWSYGGFMTSFAVTKTDRFKAASMGAGVSDLISMAATNDIPSYLNSYFQGEFWDNYELYQKHSAIYNVKKVKTPTQIIHGNQDNRVPFGQGQEFYNALDRLGIPTEMVVFPRTPHVPLEPKLLMDVTPKILNWFNKNLKR